MKNKIAKKLFFSAVALGASVLTLTTTTYAWYVQNNTVTATNITGQTASNDAGSLFISKDGRPRVGTLATLDPVVWGPTIAFDNSADFTDEKKTDFGNERNAFVPITYYVGTPAETTSPLYGKTNKFIDVNGNEVTDKTLTFTFFLLSNRASGVTVQPTLTLENTTSSKTAQTAYAAIKDNAQTQGNLVNETEEFWIDAAQALRMRVNTSSWDSTNSNWGSVANTYYDVLEVAKQPTKDVDGNWVNYVIATYGGNTVKSIDEKDLGTETIEQTTVTGAHAYYRRFVGNTPVATFVESNKDHLTHNSVDGTTKRGKMATINVNDKVTKVTVTIWLEGTDIACFDSCSGQDFKFGFDFTVVQNS